MLTKFENNLLSLGLVLMLHQLMIRAAVIQSSNNSVISQQKAEVVPQTASNVRNNVIVPLLSSSSNLNNNDVPYYDGPPSYPHGQFNNFNQHHPINEDHGHDSSDPLSRKGDEYPLDQRLPVEDPDYFYYADNPSGRDSGHYGHNHDQRQRPQQRQQRPQTNKKPKKIYKAIERVYYYPHTESEPSRNKDALNQMKEFIPDEPNDDDYQDEQEHEKPIIETRKDYQQMIQNPPRGEHEEPEESDAYSSYEPGAQSSIAGDVKEFGKEAVDEAKSFEKFLDNLRQFADNSEKEYSSPSEGVENDEEHNSTPIQDSDENTSPPRYSDSLAAHNTNDRTGDYEKVNNYGRPDEYDSEKNSYQNQRDQMDREQRGGHRYHKDRRRPRKSNAIPNEEYERRNREVSGLIDAEPEEGDYLSNYDVVKQMKNSEQKYNTGIDPVYSSKRDFDEVTRLEKMIENVALLNKKKEKAASNGHDTNEAGQGSESKTEVTTIEKKDNNQKS